MTVGFRSGSQLEAVSILISATDPETDVVYTPATGKKWVCYAIFAKSTAATAAPVQTYFQ